MADNPIKVKAYGKILNFPAGTAPEAIESALAEHEHVLNPDYKTPQPEALDYAKGFASGANKLGAGVGFLMEAAGAKESGKATREFFNRGAKYWNDRMSKGGKLASESQVFVDDDNEDSVTGIKLSDDWGNALLMGASQSLPSMFAAAIPGVAVTKGIQALAKLGLAGGAGATVPLLAGTAAPVGVTSNIIARVPSAVGFGAAEGVTAGAMNAADFKTSIEGMTDEELNKSPVYRALKEEHDPATARSLLAEQAALDLFGKTAVSTGTIGALTGGGALSQAYQKVTTGAQSGILGTMLKGAGSEALQETPQSGGEKFIENLTTQKFLDPNQSTTEGVLAAAASGGAIGAFTGGVVGAGGAINITPDRRSQLLNEKRKVAEMKADAVNNRTMEESAAEIGAAQDIDQALAAATRATTKPVVSANEVLRSEDPTLADIEKLTGLKPTEAIDTAIDEIENPIINQPQETENVSNQETQQAPTTQASVLEQDAKAPGSSAGGKEAVPGGFEKVIGTGSVGDTENNGTPKGNNKELPKTQVRVKDETTGVSPVLNAEKKQSVKPSFSVEGLTDKSPVMNEETFKAKGITEPYSAYLKAHPNKSEAIKADIKHVENKLVQGLQSTGKFDDKTNQAYATPFREFYKVNAERQGVMPSELYERLPLKFKGSQDTGEVLKQGEKTPTIKIKGVDRPTVNSEGKSIPNPEKFYEWFGDDTNVDEEGRPRVLYHSTLEDKEQFDPVGEFMGYSGTSGISLTDNKEMASRYLDRFGNIRYDGTPFSKNVMPVYARLGKTLKRDKPFATNVRMGAPLPEGYVPEHKKLGYDTAIFEDSISRKGSVKHSSAKNALRGREYIVTDPTQVKSAIGNSGEFNPNDPNILKQRDRAGFNPRTFTISLMDGSDLSSVIHEGGHFYLEALAEMASQPNAPEQIVNDFDTTLQWFGVEKDAWQSMPLEQKRPYHEQWAQSFERYALEGKAPSKEMQSVFDRFQEWMLDVYKSLKEFLKQNPLAGKLNDEVRGVFDRLLATEQDIAKSREAPTKERSLKNGERAKQLERKLREQGYDFTITAKDVRDFAAGDRGKEIEANTAEKIAGIFGRKIVWIDAQGDYDINGVVVPSIKDTIFIDVNTDKAAHAIMGHELSHHLEHDNPDVYDDLLDALSTVIRDHQGYAKKYGIEGVRKDDITKEIVGDIMGDNFTKSEFWNRVAEASPSTFKSIADSIIKWLKNLILKAKSRGLGSDQWVTDSQKAQDILAKAIAKYGGTNDSVAEDGAKFHKVWHGSPHDHSKFDSTKIGTGEGAQAYGYGHYFAGRKDVAEWYRRKLSPEIKFTEDEATKIIAEIADLNIPKKVLEDFDGYLNLSESRFNSVTNRSTIGERKISAINALKDFITEYIDSYDDYPNATKKVAEEVKAIIRKHTEAGKLYEVELAPEQEDYLLWDKPLSEQSEKVKSALSELDPDTYSESGDDYDTNETGQIVYHRLSNSKGYNEKTASEKLHSLGIRGIKYLDGTSRSKGEGAYNYVVFDDKDIEITAKFSKKAMSQPKLSDVLDSWEAKGVNGSASENNGIIRLNKIIVPKSKRNSGIGTSAMQELLYYADQTRQQIALTPTDDFGGSKSKLQSFYKKFGFHKNKEFNVMESLIRDPVKPIDEVKFSKAYEEYRMSDTSPGREDNAPLHDLTGGGNIYPEDVYSRNAVQYYGTGDDKIDRQSFEKARLFRGKPNAVIEVYRAVPKDIDGEINPGDWVSINKTYAIDHGKAYFDDYKILSKKVKASEIFTNGDSIHEWGYHPEGQTGESVDAPMFSEDNRLTNINQGSATWKAIVRENPAVKFTKGKVTVFRATVGDSIRVNDFVALNKDIAEQHLENLKDRGEDGKIINKKVLLDDLLMANDATEFVYYPKENIKFSKAVPKTINISGKSLSQFADAVSRRYKAKKTGQSKGSIYYLLPDGREIRVSDHEFPRRHGGGVAHVDVVYNEDDNSIVVSHNEVKTGIATKEISSRSLDLKGGNVGDAEGFNNDVEAWERAVTEAINDVVNGVELKQSATENTGAFSKTNDDIRFSFAGRESETADVRSLESAQSRIEAGDNAEAVRRETGWFKGVDDKWRYEINDKDASLKKPFNKRTGTWYSVSTPVPISRWTLGNVLDHPALYAAYPMLKDVRIGLTRTGRGGQFNPKGNTINIGGAEKVEDVKSILLHEIQHGIQNLENFARGGSPSEFNDKPEPTVELKEGLTALLDLDRLSKQFNKTHKEVLETGAISEPFASTFLNKTEADLDYLIKQAKNRILTPYEKYRRLAGEVESRNVESRLEMDESERRSIPPSVSQDIPDSDVIVTVNGKDMESAPPPSNAEPFDPNTDIPETLPRKAQRLTQDAFNRFTVIKDWLEEKGITLSEKADVYQAEERYNALVANQLEDFREQKRNPLIEKIAKAGFTMADVSDFLEAQHAAEANAAIQKISNNDTDTAYGITDEEAADYLAKADPKLATLANELRDITEESKQMRLKAGLLSQEEVDAWESTYEHYIPVKGDVDAKGGTGKGLKVNFKTKRRLGHGRRDESVIENIFLDHERAIMQVEKNRVAKHLVMMAAEMKMPEIMTVGQPVKRKTLRNTTAYEVKVSGVTRSVFNNKQAADMFKQLLPSLDKGVSPNDVTVEQTKDQRIVAMASPMLAENEINAYIDGHAIRVQINDDLLARAYAKLGVTGFSALVSAGRAFNGYLSKVYTGYNPEFIVTNIRRDFLSGLINLTGEEGIVMAGKAVKNYAKSFGSLMAYARSNGKKSDKWIDMYRANGGNTGAAYLSDLERLGDEVKTEYAAYQGVMANLKSGSFVNASRAAGRKAFNATLKWIYNLNQAGENAMRLAAFRAMVESGRTKNEAAKIAKNITVNFNRKGELGAEANAAYLFFNASVQGTAAIAHAHFKGKHKYQAWGLSSSLVGLGYMAAMALLGGDDDEYDKIDDHTKSRNMLIKAGEGYVKVPVPYGSGFFWNLGRAFAEAEHTGEWGKLPWQITSSFIEEFTPFSDTVAGSQDGFHFDQVMLGLAPTVAKIPLQPAFNIQLFTGGEMYPESPFQKFQPDREKYWRATQGTVYDKMAGVLEEAIGADVSPETLKHYTRTFTGGAGATVDSGVSALLLKKDGVELEPSEIPFVRKEYMKLTIREHRAAYYKAREEAKKTAEEFTRAKARNDITTINKIVKDEAEMIGLDAYANKLSKAISAMRDTQDAIRLDDSLNAAEKRVKIKELEITEQKFYDQYLDVFKIEKAKMKARAE